MLHSSTFYKRPLPAPPAVAFSSAEGKEVFAEAMLQGTMEGFFKLIEQFRTQDEPAFCGLASITMVLNALAIDPKRAWKGPWRWFHEQMLDCCQPLTQVLQTGIALDQNVCSAVQAACLARCNGALAEVHRHSDFTLEDFRAMVVASSISDQKHIVVSYTRKQFLQTGDGHFSPIGGYHADKDLVLVLDTARFKYPPHWVPLADLYMAMAPADPATGKPRGYISLTANPHSKSVMFTLDRSNRAWQAITHFLDASVPDVLHAASMASGLHLPGGAPESVVPHSGPAQASASDSNAVNAQQTTPTEAAKTNTVDINMQPQQASCLNSNTGSSEPVPDATAAATTPALVTACSSLPPQQALPTQPNQKRNIGVTQQAYAATAALAGTSNHIHYPQQAISLETHATCSADPTQHALPTAAASSGLVISNAKGLLSQILQAIPAETVKQALAVRQGPASCCSSRMPCIPVEATKQFLAELHSTELFQAVNKQLADIPHGSGPFAELHATELSQKQQAADSAPQLNEAALQSQQAPLAEQACLDTSYSVADSAEAVTPFPLKEAFCMLLLLVPSSTWQGITNLQVRQQFLSWLDARQHSLVALEASYLAVQLSQLPSLRVYDS